MASQKPQPSKAGFGLTGLYANLLDPQESPTISRGPNPSTLSKEQPQPEPIEDESQTKKPTATFRFQPLKRTPLPQKAKPKVPKPAASAASTAEDVGPTSTTATGASRPVTTTTLADWAATASDDDVNGFYIEKRPRGGRKKRKKNARDEPMPMDWDDIYDPSRPNNYEEYKNSEEKVREIREWKDLLYAHRRRRTSSSDSDRNRDNGMNSNRELGIYFKKEISDLAAQFAPPGSYSFAPPSNYEAVASEMLNYSIKPDDATGDDAFARRMQMSGSHSIPPPPPEQLTTSDWVTPAPPPVTQDRYAAATISRPPILHSFPKAPPDIPTEDELADIEMMEEADQSQPEEPRSLRPGQKGFAERLMAKYGWKKGMGLGASGTGIVAPIRVEAQKNKKPDKVEKKLPIYDEDGYIISEKKSGPKPAMGRIIAPKSGKTKKTEGQDQGAEAEQAEKLSKVVELKGMLANIALDDENRAEIMQDIGDECSSKYGRVERVFVSGDKVYVKFTSEMSALRALAALQGRMFAGNEITATYFDEDKFEAQDFS